MRSSLVARLGGVVMLGVFGINVYIGLYDTSLAQLSPLHWELNWLIAVVDLVAAVVLLVQLRNTILNSFAGIVWPVVYVANLLLDVETRLCLGTPVSTCSPTVSDAYQYLILGSASEEWVLWPYTIRLAIALVILTLILVSIAFFTKPREKPSTAASVGKS